MFDFLENIGNIFDRKPEQAVGLDIGTKSIKAVYLRKKEKKDKISFVLENYALSFLESPEHNIKDLNIEQIANIIQEMFVSAGIIAEHVIMSVSAFSTFLTLIEIPKVSQQNVQELINIEAKKYVPVSLETVTLGWHIISQKEKTMSTLLIAVPRESTQKIAQIAKQAELDLKGIEVETFALSRSLSLGQDGLSVIIDIGVQGTNITIVQKGIILMQRALSLSQDKVKNNPNIAANEVRSICQIFNQKYNKKIKKIILTGGGANSENIARQFKSILSMEVAKGNPWKNIFYKNKKLYPYLRGLDASFSVAIGLALKDLI
ncbi:hypothetical protein CL633_03770 [bacterium]|nr:hypothetical protein [bacterium]|tara:strand:+ start:1650 stop:2606 length:957 start_codon:yes stop_codon:yes gene_type:complete